jgi:preprotein translocase subunit YajC
MASLLPLLLIVVVGYFLLMRPARNRQRQQAATLRALEPGSRIMTTSGLFARVLEVDGDDIVLETSPGVTSRWLRAAVSKVLPEETPAEPGADDEEPQPGGPVDDTDGHPTGPDGPVK